MTEMDTKIACLEYPRNNQIKFLEVELTDVRAADNIRISYDFKRNGWKIEQASVFEWDDSDTTDCDPDWQEVAFIYAWARRTVAAQKKLL